MPFLRAPPPPPLPKLLLLTVHICGLAHVHHFKHHIHIHQRQRHLSSSIIVPSFLDHVHRQRSSDYFYRVKHVLQIVGSRFYLGRIDMAKKEGGREEGTLDRVCSREWLLVG